MTNQEIIASIRLSGFPDNLLDAEIEEAIRFVLREIKFEYPAVVLGTFTTVACQQVYDLFNPVPFVATSQGVFPAGLRALELLSPGSGGSFDTYVFSIIPLIQGGSYSFGLGLQGSFHTPGDWVLWDSAIAAWAHRFAPGLFEHVSDLPGAAIKVYPVPQTACQALLRFTRPRTEAEIRGEDEAWFLRLVEARCCRTLAGKLSLCAGMTLLRPLVMVSMTVASLDP